MGEPLEHRKHHKDVDDGISTSMASTKSDSDRDERRRARAQRKIREHLAALGLDENGEPLDNFSLLKYPVREYKFTFPGSRELVAMNPVVTLLAVVCLWSLVVWTTLNPIGASTKLISWRDGVTRHFTWFYQLSKAVMFAFIMYITYRYGHIHLGTKKDKPEYSTPTYFCMIFAANVGSSLLAYAASDPLFLQIDHFYQKAGYRSQDELDMFAVNTYVSSWAIGNWIGMTVVAVCASLLYRFNLPLTLRACCFPILGAYTWGWMGDIIDTLSIVVAIACMCAMLGTTAIELVAGLVHLGVIDENRTNQEITSIQSVVIWIITIMSTLSVLSGLKGGIQHMSVVAIVLGGLVTSLIFAMDDTKFTLNLAVQETGYFLQNSLFQLNLWTDAFGQLREGSGRAVDGKAAESWWMGSWSVVYQAWSICLASVIGLFVAYISRGRKVYEVVAYSFGAPILSVILWCSIWAGISLRQSRQAIELMGLGETYFNNSGHFLADGSELCYDVPQADVVVDEQVIFTNHLPGVTPVCSFDPDNPSLTAYNIFESFRFANDSGRGMSTTLSFLFILGCTFFYVAHSDASTFIVDTLASNGRKNYHWSRRMFWAGTIAALSTALVSSTSGNAAVAVNAFTILCSFPMAILLCFLMQSITLLCQAAEQQTSVKETTEYVFPEQPVFDMPV